MPHEAKDRFFESFYNVIAEGVYVAYKVGCGLLGAGCRVQGAGVEGVGCRGVGCRVKSAGCRIQGVGV